MATVRVSKTTAYRKNGDSYLDSAKTKIYDVAAIYANGKVRTSSGDVWNVIPNGNKNESDFIAVS